LAAIAEIPTVVSSVFRCFNSIQLNISKVFLILNLNGVYFVAHAYEVGADSALFVLTDVWNEV
jgi:hypothetical protein